MTGSHGGLRPGAGRPRVLDDDDVANARRRIAKGQRIEDVAKALGVHRTTLMRALKRTSPVAS